MDLPSHNQREQKFFFFFFSVRSQEIYGHIRMIGYSEMSDPKKSFISYALMGLRKWMKFYFAFKGAKWCTCFGKQPIGTHVRKY